MTSEVIIGLLIPFAGTSLTAALALAEMEQRAQERGANAVVGVDIDYEVLGSNNGMLMVSASGTAVVVE